MINGDDDVPGSILALRRVEKQALDKQLALYRDNPDAAAKAIRVGESVPTAKVPAEELAAWTMVANLVLNLDETLNRN